MKNLTISSVVSAYNANKVCTKSKFWGLLAIVSSIDYTVKPGYNYEFDASKVSNLLEKLFCLEDDIKHYQNSSLLNVMFSKKWAEKASELLLSATPNIYDVATWYYRRTRFPDDITVSGMIKMFLESTHISEADAKQLFSFNNSKNIEFSEASYSESDLRKALGLSSSKINAEGGNIVANPGELSRAPFIQTLYAGQSQMECLIITQFKFSELYVGIPDSRKDDTSPKETAQTIYYGCPGSGKSFEVKRLSEGKNGEKTIWYSKEKDGNGNYPRVENPSEEEKKNLTNNIFRTTFHPDYDYATFVGCYKPVKNDSGLDYQFIPQVFTNAYVTALRHPDDPVYLIIEEINRGNCAQIFGDLFQLLDRDENGESVYPIVPDTELSKYLRSQEVPSEELVLPRNLHIYATMNTSDQSLFPMDSAFKRRWAMEYMPINYKSKEASSFTFKIGDTEHSWVDFLQKVNEMILNATDSEDKQMGEFFIKSSVSEKEFINKVMFFIWNDVCKDLYSSRRISPLYFMRIAEPEEGERDVFTFADLFGPRNADSRLLKGFLAYLDGKYSEKHSGTTSSAAQQDDSVTPESN